MNKFNDQEIIESWKSNVKPWVSAIRKNEIESRLLVTNKAIVDAVIGTEAKSCLDAGCGEGWLVRELGRVGIDSLGVDVVPDFIASAQIEGGGRFKVVPYENLYHDVIKEKFDAVVCNFSLLGNEAVVNLFEKVPFLLNPTGYFIVQTIHPVFACGDSDYIDGWREGTWSGFSNEFSNPAPWYFRTIETWKKLFLTNGFSIGNILEPMNKKTESPASIIFVGVKNS